MPAPVPRRRFRWLLAVLAPPVLLLVAVIALFCIRAWVYGFLRSDDFRHFLDRKASAALRSDARFQALHWEDTEVFTESFQADGGSDSPFTQLTLEQVRARLDLYALWQHVWRVETVDIEKLSAAVRGPGAAPLDRAAAAAVKPSASRGEGEGRNLFAGWLPSEVRVSEVRVNDFELGWAGGRLNGVRVTAHPGTSAPETWEIDGRGGDVRQAGFPTLHLDSFNVRSSPHEVFLTRADGQAENGGRLDLAGRQSLDGDRLLDLTANFDRLPVTDFLPDDWRARVHGVATGLVHLTGSADEPGDWHAKGHVDLRDGRLEALPLLDQLALFTATQGFRQTPLQKCHADFDRTGTALTVSNLLVESEGLLRIEGGFTVQGDQIDGTLNVGVARNSLRWIAALGLRVFNLPEHDGYVWTSTHLTGPVRHPSEDLTPRLAAAAQQEVIDKAKGGAGAVLDTAGQILDLLK